MAAPEGNQETVRLLTRLSHLQESAGRLDDAERTLDEAPALLVCALGGEGGGVLTEWLIDTARHAGYAAQATSIPGVAQRTGATTYYIEVFPVPLTQLGGKRPVFKLSAMPSSSSWLKTLRSVPLGKYCRMSPLVFSPLPVARALTVTVFRSTTVSVTVPSCRRPNGSSRPRALSSTGYSTWLWPSLADRP